MWKTILITVVMIAFVPTVFAKILEVTKKPEIVQQNKTEQKVIEEEIPQKEIPPKEIPQKKISVLCNGDVVCMDIEEYLVGVVLAEMPADFELEALKAQAVAARTFSHKRLMDPKHTGADLCTESACCQAYCSPESYRKDGGQDEAVRKVQQAVADTQGQVILYQGELIEATYFACSGGRTEDAAEVWGAEVPYLKAVDSPGEEKAASYTNTLRFPLRDFCDKLNITDHSPDIGQVIYTEGGGVQSIVIGGKEFSGTDLRKLLGLRSTAFVITIAGDTVIITTKGFGHRVGMSQYGADAMAVQGKRYDEILSYYYQGTEIVCI